MKIFSGSSVVPSIPIILEFHNNLDSEHVSEKEECSVTK